MGIQKCEKHHKNNDILMKRQHGEKDMQKQKWKTISFSRNERGGNKSEGGEKYSCLNI